MKRNLVIIISALYLSGCATVNGVDTTDRDKQLVKTVATIVVLGAVMGAVGKQNQQSKCANNRAGFWQDHSTGKIYTCP